MARDLRYGSYSRDDRELAAVAQAAFGDSPEAPNAGSELGFYGVGIDAAVGGSDGTLTDLAIIVESAGAVASAASIVEVALVAAPLLAENATDFPRWSSMLAGETLVSLPVSSPWEFAGSGLVTFERTFLGGDGAGVFVLPWVVDGRESVLVLDPSTSGLTVERMEGMDPRRTTWRVTASKIDPSNATLTATRPGIFLDFMARRALGAALDAVGAARAALLTTLDYAEVREQFGRPIASLQAYKHRCADALVQLNLAQSLAFNAAKRLEEGSPFLALCAGRESTRDATFVCGEAVQLHGAIGFTWEAGIHALLKRARLDEIIGRGCRTAREKLIELDYEADQRSR